jgi:hypothetical protein
VKQYTVNRFICDNYEIPNLSSIGIEKVSTDENERWSNSTLSFRVIGTHEQVMSVAHGNYLSYYDGAYCSSQGYISTTNGYGRHASSSLDGMYYLANPPKYYKRNGDLKPSFWQHLRIRINNDTTVASWVTAEMLDIANTMFIADYRQLSSEDVRGEHLEGYLKLRFHAIGITSDYKIRFCAITMRMFQTSHVTKCNLSGTQGYICRTINLVDHGYRADLESDAWLKEGEYTYQTVVYKTIDGICLCSKCTKLVPNILISIDDEDGSKICAKCTGNKYKIHNYSTRAPDLLSFKAKRVRLDTTYLGIELEYETSNKEAARVAVGKLMVGHAIMKSDGSIKNGFEIVTCPATIDIHLEVFDKFFKNLPTHLQIDSNVGMHVHVSRKNLSTLTQGKISRFMNKESNLKLIEFVAGRTLNLYCRQDSYCRGSHVKMGEALKYPLNYSYSSARYNVLNLNNNATIEFRIFSTPMTGADFSSKVEFCQALTDFSRPCATSLSLDDLSVDSVFIAWVLKNRKSYPSLASKLKGFV